MPDGCKTRIVWPLMGLLLMAGGFGAAGCRPLRLRVSPCRGERPVEGIVYTLPKNLLRVDVAVTLQWVDELVLDDDSQSARYRTRVRAEVGEADLTPVAVADTHCRYEIRTSRPGGFLGRGSFSLAQSEEGFLTAAGLETEDLVLEALQGLADLGFKIIRPAGAGDSDQALYRTYTQTLSQYRRTLERRERLIEEVLRASLDGKTALDVAKKALDLLAAVEKTLSLRLGSLRRRDPGQKTVTLVQMVDPQPLEAPRGALLSETWIDAAGCPALAALIRRFAAAGITVEGWVERFWLGIYSTDDGAVEAMGLADEPPWSGYVYRLPRDCRCCLRAHGENGPLVLEERVRINQFGSLALLPVTPGRLGRRTFELTLHRLTGSISRLEVSSERAPASVLTDTALEVAERVESRSGVRWETEKLLREIELLEAKIERIEAERELEALEEER